jgi:nickel transport protein
LETCRECKGRKTQAHLTEGSIIIGHTYYVEEIMKKFPAFTFFRCHKIIFGSACLVSLCLMWSVSAMAHRVNVFAWVEGGTVHTESKFSGGKGVKDGEVLIYDLEGSRLFSGRTDAQGEFSFRIPQKTGMKIVVQAGMGHRGEWTIPLSEIDPRAPIPETPVSQEGPSETAQSGAATSSVNLDQMQHILEQSLDRRLGPVLKLLAESRDRGPTLQDILGGIGYVFGLMGLAAYVHFRRKTRQIESQKEG